jgi:hypothetical protein
MSSFSLVRSFLESSYTDFKEHKHLFIRSFIVLVVLNLLDAIPWEITGAGPNSGMEIALEILVGIASLFITVDVINSQVAIIRQKTKERMLYTVPSFFISQILYMLITLAGLVLVIVPGIAAFILLGLAPLLTIVEPNVSAFKRSFHLSKKEFATVAILMIGSLILEFFPYGVSLIPGWELRSTMLLILSYPLALISFLVVQSNVKLYFHLVARE